MIVSSNPEVLAAHITNADFVHTIRQYLADHATLDQFKAGEKISFDNGIYIVQIQAEPVEKDVMPLEAHRSFFDIHYTLEGLDVIASKPIDTCTELSQSYVTEHDYMLFTDVPTAYHEVPAGSFCIIPNEFAHGALFKATGKVTKIVFKVPVQ